MKTLIATGLLATVAFTGCCDKNYAPHIEDRTYVEKKCPKFNSKIKIKIDDLNSTHGAISWPDVSRIESLISSKNKFNKSVDKINMQ